MFVMSGTLYSIASQKAVFCSHQYKNVRLQIWEMISIFKNFYKGKVHPVTGHEIPEGE